MTGAFNIREFETFMTDLEKVFEKHPIAKTAIVASFVSPGVKVDGGGFVIVNGRIVPVPPRGPKDPEFNKAKLAIALAAMNLASVLPESQLQQIEKVVFDSLGMETVHEKKAVA